MTRILFPIFAVLLASTGLFGQIERSFYQSYEVDSVQRINLNLPEDFELYEWAGNTILVETHIQLFDATPTLLDFFVKQKRYEMAVTKTPEAIELAPFLADRKPIRTSRGECTEVVSVKVFVPDTFEWAVDDKKHLTLKSPTN